MPEDVLRNYDGVVLSPGPGLPETSGALVPFVNKYLGKIPILGVCLGMQALAIELGGELYNQDIVKHGVQEAIAVRKSTLFRKSDENFLVGLYHSWAITDGDYQITSVAKSGAAMSLENKLKRCYGVQFHPESIMTPKGKEVLLNFLGTVEEAEMISAG
jgi:anthranilate synthase component 2